MPSKKKNISQSDASLSAKNEPEEARSLRWELSAAELEKFKLVALGCHRSCHDAVAAIFSAYGREIVSWSLNDYFLLGPLSRSDATEFVPKASQDAAGIDPDDAKPEWKGPEAKRPQLYFPFFERRLRAMPFVPDVDPPDQGGEGMERRRMYEELLQDPEMAIRHVLNWPIRPNTQEFSKRLRRGFSQFVSHLLDDTNGLRLIRKWAHRTAAPLSCPDRLSGAAPAARPQYERQKLYSMWDGVEGLLQELLPPHETVSPAEQARRLNDAASARLEHAVNDHFWLLQHPRSDAGGGDRLLRDLPATNLIAVSIASEAYFYGYLVIEFPPDASGAAPESKLKQELMEVLRQAASNLYVDVLALFHNRIAEVRLDSDLKSLGRKSIPSLQLAAECKNLLKKRNPFGEPLKSRADIEDHLRWLWDQRVQWCDDENFSLKHLADSLTLAKMQVASAPMVSVLRDLMGCGIKYEPNAAGLPSVLVIGGPGSGKDNTARLVALFAQGYTFSPIRTINMAALRPQALVGAVLQGADWSGFYGGVPGSRFQPPLLPAVNEGDVGAASTVILDELNSLDVDQQGILLRILENREVMPVFGDKSRKAHFLCVGVMNEQPEDLMKEEELRTAAARSTMFGQLLGTMIDETFRRARRLRPDLYYRMQRFGVLKLPSLGERREDIPILFHNALPPKDSADHPIQYEVELAAYERLMEPDLQWPGNIRELQAIARRIHGQVHSRSVLEPTTDGARRRVEIKRADVEIVLREHLLASRKGDSIR